MNKPFLSIIIPAYDEARRIPLTLIDVDKRLSSAEYSYEILVVDDGSKDNTAEIVRRFMPLIKNLKLIQAEHKGKGAAVRRGVLESQGTIRLFTDADNSTSVDQFNAMLPFFKEGYGVVVGSRAISGAVMDPPQSVWRRVMGKAGNLLIRLCAVSNIYDTQCGFKALTEEAAEKIFSRARIDGWSFDVEMCALAAALHIKIKEVPVHWQNSAFSHLTLFDYPRVLWDTFKIQWWVRQGDYRLD